MNAVSARPWLALTIWVGGLTFALLLIAPRPLSPDVSGQLWIAERLLHGARLYVDIDEVNPPLWFWMAMPVQQVAVLLHVADTAVLIIAIGTATLLSLLAVDGLPNRLAGTRRIALPLYAALVLLVMPLRDFGQREQLALIGTLPYVVLVAARREAAGASPWLAAMIGAGAALGMALKPYFAGVPLMLEVWLLLGQRRDWRPIRPETLLLAAGALGYAGAVLVATPAYLSTELPELSLAYTATGVTAWRYMLRPAQPIWLLLLYRLCASRGVGQRLLPLPTALLIAAAGFAAAWLIQHKGWPYQSIPTTGMLALALMTQLAADRRRCGPIALTALAAPLLLSAVPTQWRPSAATDLAPALAGLKPGDLVGIVSREGFTVWPSTLDRGLHFAGRRPAYWMLTAIDMNAAGPRNPRIEAFGRAVVRQTAIDYRCYPPKRLIFAPRGGPAITSATDNPLGYFQRDASFSAVLRHYRRLAMPGDFAAFALASPPDPVSPSRCPRAP